VESFLEFLASNRAIIVGAALTVAEVIVIIINTMEQLKDKPEMSETVETLAKGSKKSKIRILFWIINPINIFRKV